jgi:hypothetical protein
MTSHATTFSVDTYIYGPSAATEMFDRRRFEGERTRFGEEEEKNNVVPNPVRGLALNNQIQINTRYQIYRYYPEHYAKEMS